METFTAPKTGDYKLECWGAASHPVFVGTDGFAYGGYSTGKIALNKSDAIYVAVGGAGASRNGRYGGKGGYNGGGDGGTVPRNELPGGSGGGGATHIAKRNCLLKDLENDYATNLLLVAGGAGGSSCHSSFGAGGGISGGSVKPVGWTGVSPMVLQGATQTKGNAFGIGENASTKTNIGSNGSEGNGGGGGGFWGGYAYHGEGDGSDCSGSGGSGYVNKDIIIDGDTQAGVQSPEGYDGCCIVTWFLE